MMYGSEELLLAWNIACKDEEEAHVAEEEDAWYEDDDGEVEEKEKSIGAMA